MSKYLYIMTILILSLSCNTTKKTSFQIKEQKTLINFIVSDELVKILDISKVENKPVFLYLHTEWCTPCKFMEEEVFSIPKTAEHMNTHFINYEVDMEKVNGPDLSFIFKARTIPTLLILDYRGREISRHTGSIGNMKLLSWTNEVLSNL